MTPVKAALLFVGNPTLALEHFVQSLGKRLAPQNISVEEISPEPGAMLSFRADDVTVSVGVASTPLAADSFTGALDSPLSKPVLGILSETLARHSRHMMISVSEAVGATTNSADSRTVFLTRLKLAHATTSLLAEWHMPAAIHWQQSNQLLTGAQYLQLAADPVPWALFAQARITLSGEPDQKTRNQGIRLDDATNFIGRPIQFRDGQLPLDQAHAAALSFLRHTVETGAAIPHDHTFGPRDGIKFRCHHVAPGPDTPHGIYELSVVKRDADPAPGDPACAPGAVQTDRDLVLPGAHELSGVAAPHPRERTRSMAIAYLMLVIMPPVGAILLMSNAIFGSNVWRTAVVAMASVVLAVLVGTYTFVNSGQKTALLLKVDIIQSAILSD